LLMFVLVSVLALTVPVLAQDVPPTPSPDQVNAIAKGMYCPVCENIPLDVCGTAACAQWRQQIADLLSQGYTEEEIHEYFVLQYGDRVLAEPPRRGLNWLVYIAPPLVVVAGVLFLVFYLRSLKEPVLEKGEPPQPKQTAEQDEYTIRFEEALKERYR